jgi:hypothetical protein
MSIRSTWLVALLALLPLSYVQAQARLDMAAIVKEVEMMKNTGNGMTVVMWFPEEYWRAATQASGRLTEKGADEFLAVMRPYTVVAIVAADVGAAGAFTFASPEAVRKSARLEDSAGTLYEPVDPQSTSAAMKNLLQMLRPILSNAMGPMGANMEILLFPGTNKDGARIADASKDGFFVVHLNDLAFRYHLPLGSILPPAVDARSGDTFPGNYHFNPYTGDKLTPAAVPAASKP